VQRASSEMWRTSQVQSRVAAALVQPLGVDHLAGRHRHVVGRDPLQHRLGVGALDQELGEGRHVEQADRLAHRLVLGGGVGEPVLALVAVGVCRLDALRGEPIGPLPARRLAEAGAARRQALVQRRGAHAAPGRRLVVGPVHGIELAEGFRRPLAQVARVVLERHHAADVDVGHVHRRVAPDDPLGDHLAGAAGRLDADRVEAGGDEEVAQFRRLAQVIAHVGGEALGPAEELAQAHALERRHPVHGAFQNRHEVIHVAGQLVEAEVLGDAVHAPGPGVALEGAQEDLAGVLLVVGAAVRVAQHRQVGRQAVDRVGQDVIVLAGVKRHPDASHEPHLAGPHAGAVDHVVGGDLALVGRDAGDPRSARPGRDPDGGHLGVLEDPGAAGARALGQGHGGVDRVGLAVVGQEDGADHVLDVQQRIEVARLGGRDHLHLEAGHARHGGTALQLLETLGGGGDAQAAVLLEAGGLAGLRLEAAVEPGRVDRQLDQVEGRAQLADQAGRVPGGAAGELLALQHHHLRPAELGQVIGDRAADDAAADDDHPRCLGKLIRHGLPPLLRLARSRSHSRPQSIP